MTNCSASLPFVRIVDDRQSGKSLDLVAGFFSSSPPPSPLTLNDFAPLRRAYFRETPALLTHLRSPALRGDRKKNTAMHAQNALEFLMYQIYFEPLF